MQNIVSIDTEITLYTGMSEREFAQANMFQHMKENGYCVTPTDDGYTFKEWNFFKTGSKDEKMTVSGDTFPGVILYELLASVQKNATEKICTEPSEIQKKAYKYLKFVLNAMYAAQENNIKLPNSGPIGIIVAANGSVLFLPETMLNRSVAMKSQNDAATCVESWRQLVLSLTEAFSFSVATMLYTIISGQKAFTAQTQEKITEDFLDENFIPLEYVCSAKEEITSLIDSGLKGKNKYRPTLKKLISKLPDTLEEIYEPIKNNAAEKLEKFTTKLNSRIKRTRFIRKNITPISLGAITLVLILGFALSLVKNAQERANTIGLTAIQTVESYYSAMNHLNTEEFEACVTKEAGESMIDIITSLYVIGKVQSAYGESQGYVTPAQWMLSNNKANDFVFGLTHLKIDGEIADSSAKWMHTLNKDVPGGKVGDKEEFVVTYYLFTSEGEEGLKIYYHEDKVYTEFLKDRWQVVEVVQQAEELPFKMEPFLVDFENNDTEKYEWFPTPDELKKAEEEIKEKYGF